jgi:hypothetical protein
MALGRAALLLILIAVLAGAAGCGRDDDATDVRTVTDRFFAALDGDDGELACAQLNAETRSALEDQEKSACRDAITQLDLQSSRVEGVRVYERSAMVELASGEAAFLDQGDDGWRLAAAGCTPIGDKPYDCELEA